MNRKVKQIVPVYDVDMGGVMVKQALPTQALPQVDPFLLLHHGVFSFHNDAPAIQQGLGPHPHRGFSPVTFVIDGEVHHRDSRGNNQIAKKGEVQWLHAGAGIIHSERPSQNLSEHNGEQEIIQLWINSPAEKKMKQPTYHYLPESAMPLHHSSDKQVVTKVIAGNFEGRIGEIKPESELIVLWSNAKVGGEEVIKIDPTWNAMLYLVKGELRVTGFGKVDKECLVVFENEGKNIVISAESDAEFLVLAGAPINEKVVQQGPFVMNTETEILEAMRDYQMGKMGILIEDGMN
jgi:redox-sensitive bicupin YhaK (pirin superfamily)